MPTAFTALCQFSLYPILVREVSLYDIADEKVELTEGEVQ